MRYKRKTTLLMSVKEFPMNICSTPLIVVYNKPSDFPDKYVARLFDLQHPTQYAVLKDDLQELRKSLYSMQMLRPIPREIHDDPKIVEVWL